MKKIFAALLLSLAACTVPARAEVIVIANSACKADAVTKNEVRDVFLGASISLKEAGRVRPVLLKDGATHVEFLSSFINRPPAIFLVTWRSAVLSGQATMPKTFDTEAGLVDYVAKTPGALGYIDAKTPHEGVKVLAVH